MSKTKILCVSFALVGAVVAYGLFSVELNSIFANTVTSSSSSSASNTSTATATNNSTTASSVSNANTTSNVTVNGSGSGTASGTAQASGSANATTNSTTGGTNSQLAANANSNASATSYASANGGSSTYQPALNVSCSANPNPAKVGQSVTWSAHVSGGSGNYTYTWAYDVSGSGQSVNKTYNETGRKWAKVTVTSGNKTAWNECNVDVQANPTPTPNPNPGSVSASCHASASSVAVGQPVTWIASASGGSGYSYSWTYDVSGTGSSVTKTYNEPGTKWARVTVTSSSGASAWAECTVNVQGTTPTPNPTPLNVSCSATPNPVRVGQQMTWNAHVSGGSGNYAYAWTYDVSGSGQSINKIYNEAGRKWARVNVTSGSQTGWAECTVDVQHDPSPNPTLDAHCSANPGSVRINNNTTWTAYPTGGTGNYVYEWSGDASGTSKDVTRSYSSVGTKYATVKITSGSQVITRNCTVSVFEDAPQPNVLDGYCYASPTSIREGDSITWRAVITNGPTSNPTYSWSGSDGLSGNGSTVTRRYDDNGQVRATVSITSGGQTINRDCYADVERDNDDDDDDDDDDNLNASCRVSDRQVYVGEKVTFRASASGGSGSYDYEWSGDRDADDELDDEDSRTVTVTYDTPGEKEARVRVESRNDSDTARCRVTVLERGATYVPPTYVPPTQTPQAGGVYLSQVPYTGAGDGLKISLFILSLLAWSGIVSYVLVKRKAAKEGVPVTTVLRRFAPTSFVTYAHTNYSVPTIREVNETRNVWDIIRERKAQN